MGSVVASAPTVGSNHEIYDYKGVRFGLIDIGGQTALRSSWNQYFAGTTAIILVIDSNDPARLPLAKAELQKLIVDQVGAYRREERACSDLRICLRAYQKPCSSSWPTNKIYPQNRVARHPPKSLKHWG